MDTPIIPLKRCKVCQLEFPATDEYFYRPKATQKLRNHCRACVAKRKKQYHMDHIEQAHESHREYATKNAEQRREYQKRWRAENAEKQREYKRQYYLSNRESTLERAAKYQKNNPDMVRARKNRRRGRELGASGSHTKEDLRLLFTSNKGVCWWCGKAIGNGQKWHADHIIPLARGGSNAADNLCIACPSCNASKGSKLPHEWNGRMF